MQPADRRLNELTFRPVSEQELRDTIEPHFERQFGRTLPLLSNQSDRFLFSVGQELAGWHFGRTVEPGVYMMTNTMVLSEFRRQGIYARFLKSIVSELGDRGLDCIVSRHRPDNHAVLFAKKAFGFVEIVEEIDPQLGRLVVLEYSLRNNKIP